MDAVFCLRRYNAWKLKSLAWTGSAPTSSIVADTLSAVPDEAKGALPKITSLQKTVRRARKDSQVSIPPCNSRSELPKLYGKFLTPSGEDFVKWDNEAGNGRILIFSTDGNLKVLEKCDHWFADGTFKTRPLLFDQLFVFHGLLDDGANRLCVPLVYCLTPNRTTKTYTAILEKLKTLNPALAPKSIMTDFEQAFFKVTYYTTLKCRGIITFNKYALILSGI